jgi:hypothetical protein
LQDTDWLKNKMRALSHLFCTSPGDDDDSRQLLQTSITCEYALAARLLLEEQELDGGQSNGKSGKYASRYHPQQTTSQVGSNKNDNNGSSRNSRPLTVGEISINWPIIRDTVRTKYHCNYKDPMPILQDNLEHQQHQQLRLSNDFDIMPTISTRVRQVLSSSSQQDNTRFVIMVNHPSEVSIAELTLQGISYTKADSAQEAIECNSRVVFLLKTSKDNNSIIRDLIAHSPIGCTSFVVDSSNPCCVIWRLHSPTNWQ